MITVSANQWSFEIEKPLGLIWKTLGFGFKLLIDLASTFKDDTALPENKEDT